MSIIHPQAHPQYLQLQYLQMGRIEKENTVQDVSEQAQADMFWMIPGPIKWAAGSLGGVLNNVNPFKSPRRPDTTNDATTPPTQQALVNTPPLSFSFLVILLAKRSQARQVDNSMDTN